MRHLIPATMALLLCTMPASANDRDTYFHADTQDGAVELVLRDAGNGQYSGTLKLDSFPMPVNAVAHGNRIQGRIGDGYETYPFDATLVAGRLHLRFDGEEALVLEPGPLAANRPSTTNAPAASAAYNAQTNTPGADISINGKRLDANEVRALAQYGVQAQSGNYWYDAVSGAWGAWGGPTAGFVAAGIPSAPLPSNASNGMTGVLINGRNITQGELAFLQNLARSPIPPGQYWLDANGYAGQVGGPPLINFLQAAQTQQQPQTSSWYGKNAAGYSSSDGSGGIWIANPHGGTGTTVTY